MRLWALLFATACFVLPHHARDLFVGPAFLRSGSAPEWQEFATRTNTRTRFELSFSAESNQQPATLWIEQDDVRHDWRVELNGRRLGQLFLMEAHLVSTFTVPPGSIRNGTNRLTITSPRENDDVAIYRIELHSAPSHQAGHELSVLVEDESGEPIPARITIVNESGALAPLMLRSNSPFAAVRPGVAYVHGGALLGLREGRYTVFASRGFEWSVATQQIAVVRGSNSTVRFTLRREVPTPGLVSCDTHIHTLTHSGHGDATEEERVLTLAGEGIELPVVTEHNRVVTYRDAAARLGMSHHFTLVPGNEVTTSVGHFNVFPANATAPLPDHQLTNWPALFVQMRRAPSDAVIVLNHPRSVHNGFQPFGGNNFHPATGRQRSGFQFTFDAVELLNSSAQQSDYMLVVRDWLALLNRGHRITAVGSSDSHDVSRYIVGQGRTYVRAHDRGHIDVAEALHSLRTGRALVSMGLLADITVQHAFGVGDTAVVRGPEMLVTVRVMRPSWISASNVTLFGNGERIADAKPRKRAGGVEAFEWRIPKPNHDVFLVAMANGPGVDAPFWAIPRPYQPTSRHWQGRVIAITNPVWVDADGDGQFTPARGYAEQIVDRVGVVARAVTTALKPFDAAVATHVAELCAERGANFSEESWRRALRSAPAHVREGFARFRESARTLSPEHPR
jgi:hypothetical protein